LLGNLDFVSEHWEKAWIREEAFELRATRRYNSKVKPRTFHKGHLV